MMEHYSLIVGLRLASSSKYIIIMSLIKPKIKIISYQYHVEYKNLAMHLERIKNMYKLITVFIQNVKTIFSNAV